MKRADSRVSPSAIVEAARSLSDHDRWPNPEYDRALVELTARLLGRDAWYADEPDAVWLTLLDKPMPSPNVEEQAALGHLRGDCHNGDVCPICKAERRAFEAEQRLNFMITGECE